MTDGAMLSTPEASYLLGYLEQRQHLADTRTWWRRLRTRAVPDEQRWRRARGEFRALVGRVDQDRRGPAANPFPGLDEACRLVEDSEFREQAYAVRDRDPRPAPWWKEATTPPPSS